MGRPLKDRTGKPVRLQIEDTFWELLREKNYAQVSVSEIVRKVGCNRGTFYYHFDSIEDLTAQAIEETIPAQIPALAEAYFMGTRPALELDADSRTSIERLCLLMGKGGSPGLTNQIKQYLRAIWAKRYDLDYQQEDVACIMEFMASGVVGILGYWGTHSSELSLDECLLSVFGVFSKPAVTFALQHPGRQC